MDIQNPVFIDTNGNEISLNGVTSQLGEVKMFALSMTGAVTKSILQSNGWAICDGTTPVAQGITSPTIETTPNLEHTFIRMSDDESSGGTGGSDTISLSHTHTISDDGNGDTGGSQRNPRLTTNSSLSSSQSILPTYYEVAFFMKVK